MVTLNALKEELAPEFDILAVPSNIFGLMEPGTNKEILDCFKYVRPGNNYEPNFELTQKVDVNGANEHQLYTFLKVSLTVQLYLLLY